MTFFTNIFSRSASRFATSIPLIPTVQFWTWLVGVSSVAVVAIASLMYYLEYVRFTSSAAFRYIAPGASEYSELFDFIVVGAGSAGAVVAARLSENFKVLLLEAGGTPHPFTYVPILNHFLLNEGLIDHQYSTEPQKRSALSVQNNKMPYPRGKAIGGCSNNNGMVYMRGNPNDYDLWAKLSGDEVWSYRNVERVFRKLEDYQGNWKDNGFHGTGGPIKIHKSGYERLLPEWLEAGRELGFAVDDLNGFQKQGFSPVDVTQQRGLRFGTFRGYIQPNIVRKNLHIYRYSSVTKVHFNDSLHATGVSYFRHGGFYKASATKEIILCAGTINSAEILLKSGIGPKDHLQFNSVKSVMGSPVGQNVQDHVGTFLPFLIDKPLSFLPQRDLTLYTLGQYLLNGGGPFSNSAVGNSWGTAQVSSQFSEEKNWPDIQLNLISVGIESTVIDMLQKMYKINPGTLGRFTGVNDVAGKDGLFVNVIVARPKSRGSITLGKSILPPFSKVRIDPDYFSDERNEDMQILVEGINLTLKLLENTTAFRNIGARLIPYKFQSCEQEEYRSFKYWECYARHLTISNYDIAGSCQMGRESDSDAVVNSKLKVIGVNGLRVADASIMPMITNANTHGPAMMIGEMASELIVEEWRRTGSR